MGRVIVGDDGVTEPTNLSGLKIDVVFRAILSQNLATGLVDRHHDLVVGRPYVRFDRSGSHQRGRRRRRNPPRAGRPLAPLIRHSMILARGSARIIADRLNYPFREPASSPRRKNRPSRT